jgi:hypothetical protein
VVLRSINSSLSAYLSVTYNANFFDSYDVLDCTVVQAGLQQHRLTAAARPSHLDEREVGRHRYAFLRSCGLYLQAVTDATVSGQPTASGAQSH